MTEYKPCDILIEVKMADGTTSPALGCGTICLSKLKLKSVLYVPGLSYNLLSVSQLTNDMNCRVIFFPSHYLSQDQASRMMIGRVEAKDGLYWLTGNISNFFSLNKLVLTVTTNAKAMLWHKQLGHPNFPYLTFLYPHIFINKDQSFSCEQCTLAK